jgi:FKBP-type peptidyl-prolyl cis-trans isomerase SlyD
MKITSDAVVSIEYTLTNDDGEVLDTSVGKAPLTYLQGRGQLVPGLEKALEGKASGEEMKVSLTPDEGYGQRSEERVMEVERASLPPGIDPEVGMTLAAEGPGGTPIPLWVREVGEKTVTLDGNHPLSGKALHFDVKVRDVREATAEELEHGHAHGEGGHHH